MFSRDVYLDQKAPAYALLVVTIRKYGFEFLDVEPALLRHEIEKDYDIKLTELQSNKLQAAITILTTNMFETDWRVFECCVNVLNNEATDCDSVNPAEAEEIAVALAEFALIKNDSSEKDDPVEYDDEIRAYAGRMFFDYGFHSAPDLFPSAIMPASAPSDDKEKNAALEELFKAQVDYVLNYVDKLS